MRSLWRLRFPLAALVAAFACAQAIPATSSSFTATTGNAGNTATAAADWTAPSIDASVLQKGEGGAVDKLHPNDTFYVYASVSDTGNPSAGVGTMTASVGNLATVSSATLSAGSWTVAGTTYNRRTALLTAKSTLGSGTFSYSLSVSDGAGNGPTAKTASAASSDATFAPATIATANATGIAGRPDAGDTITFTYSSAPDPESIFPGWDGTSRTVEVDFADQKVYGTTSDIVGVVGPGGAGTTTALGYVTSGGNYVTQFDVVRYVTSTIALSGSTFTVTLGAPDVATNTLTDSNNRTPQWTSTSSAFDTFGNPSVVATVTGVSRKQF